MIFKVLTIKEMISLNEDFDNWDILNYNTITSNNEAFFFCLFDKNILIGFVKIKINGVESIRSPGFFNWLSFIEVRKDFQRKGFSKKIIFNLFDFLVENNYSHLLISSYTEEGLFLDKYFKKMQNKYKNIINIKING